LLKLAADFVAADVMAWRRAGTPAPTELATRLETLQDALNTALAELRLVAGTLADRCPVPETWTRLKEYDHLLRGQREMLYQPDIWESEVIQPIKTEHARVLAKMKELAVQLRGAVPRKEPGRRPKYKPELIDYVRKLQTKSPSIHWKGILMKCKEKYPDVKYPCVASFRRRMQDIFAKERGKDPEGRIA
jgi:hypothetical protein